MRVEEEFAKTAFDAFLKVLWPLHEPKWELPEQDPPDYWLEIRQQRWAVEVTSLVMQYESNGTRPLTELGIRAMIHAIEKEINHTANEQGLLQGLYDLHFRGPYINLRESRKNIIAQVLGFLESTASDEETSPERLTIANGPKCTIQKFRGTANILCCSSSTETGGWKNDIRREIRELIHERISKKAPKMAKLSRPRMLLLVDQYHLADLDDFPTDVNTFEGIAQFDHVFLIKHDQNICPVWPRESNAIDLTKAFDGTVFATRE